MVTTRTADGLRVKNRGPLFFSSDSEEDHFLTAPAHNKRSDQYKIYEGSSTTSSIRDGDQTREEEGDKVGYRADDESGSEDNSSSPYSGDENIPGSAPSSTSLTCGETDEDIGRNYSLEEDNPKYRASVKQTQANQRNRRSWMKSIQKHRARRMFAKSCNVSCSHQARNPPETSPPSTEDEDQEGEKDQDKDE